MKNTVENLNKNRESFLESPMQKEIPPHKLQEHAYG